MSTIQIEHGAGILTVEAGYDVAVKGVRRRPPLRNPRDAIRAALAEPVASNPLAEIVRARIVRNRDARAVIVVGDNTRPVPYRGEDGILPPIIEVLAANGCARENILVLIATGSHRAMTGAEIEAMLGLGEAGLDVAVKNHDYANTRDLSEVGRTGAGEPILISKAYLQSDIKICTGLVEPHFMAGASGGRKAICPGIAGKETLLCFHSARRLASPMADDLVLEGNPVSDFAADAADMAGCDFILNVTLNERKEIGGVFAGNIHEAHKTAVLDVLENSSVALDDEQFDIVIVPAGHVGRNHYQAAKAAFEASKAVRRDGTIILTASHNDDDPVGQAGYKAQIAALRENGWKQFMRKITADDWQTVPEQWQVQMWCKVFEKLNSERQLIYCTVDIPAPRLAGLPCRPGYDFADRTAKDPHETVSSMVRGAVNDSIRALESMNRVPKILFLKDGPYGAVMASAGSRR